MEHAMKKNLLFALIAVAPLALFSCAKEVSMDVPEVEDHPAMLDPWTAVDQMPYIKPVEGKKATITVGPVETKSHLDMTDPSYGKVTWKSGDGFRMATYDPSIPQLLYADFSTTESGEKASFSTMHGLTYSPQHSIHVPDLSKVKLSYDENGPIFGVNVPPAQTAVAGGVADGLTYSYAKTTSFTDVVNGTEDMHFTSILSLVRFKMTGAIASSVTSVTIRGGSALAGDCVLIPTGSGVPQLSFNVKFGEDVASSTVTLSGSFLPDTYYYFAVVPGTQNGFSLEFSDGIHTTTKIASKSVNFARGQITDIGTIDLGSAFLDPATPSTDPITFMSATAGAPKPVTIAVIPEGFTASEMSKYEMLAKSAMNTLFSVEPFKSYKEYFNVYILKVASNASGANITNGGGTITTAVDCYFGSKWGATTYGDMTADHDKVFNFVKDNCPDITGGKHSIYEVPILMIINDARYGGINWTFSDGRAYCMAPYSFDGGGMSWPYPNYEANNDENPSLGYSATSAARLAEVGANAGSWLNTMVHEFGGHCFSRLKDEYWYGPDEVTPSSAADKGATEFINTHRYTVPYGLNISASYLNPGKDDYSGAVGWQHLLDKKAELAAGNPLYNRIGVYQGGDVSIFNRWRSERVSCMIDNRFYFSTFQRELIVKRIMTLAGKEFNETEFWAKDVPIDPVRDIVASPVMGEPDPVAPRPMPMLPPPRLVVVD